MSILERCLFSSLRLRFDSRIFLFNAGGRVDLRRRSFSRAAICARRSARCRSSIASSKRCRASLRFIACDRESWTVTLIPLGRCRSVTAVETLFTFWPPGPPDRANVSSRSASRMPSLTIRFSIELSICSFCSTQIGATFSRPCLSTRAIQISSFKNVSTRRTKF